MGQRFGHSMVHFGHYYEQVYDHHQKVMSYNVVKKMT
jgi:hypothetical protein